MALILTETVETNDGCIGFVFNDTTGTYNVSTNPGGYGAPNIDSSEVNFATIGIYPPNSTVPYVLEFEIETGNISDVTLRKLDGTQEDVTADFITYSFPFVDMNISETYFGFTEGDAVTDGVWTFQYDIEDEEGNTANTTDYELATCGASCCIQKMFVNLPTCGCDCGKEAAALSAETKLKAAIYSANLGMMAAAQSNIDKANELCSNNCKSC